MPPEDRLSFEDWLQEHPDIADEVRSYRELNETLHGAFDHVLDEAVPFDHELSIAAHITKNSFWGWQQMAAGIALVLFGSALGWFSHDRFDGIAANDPHFLSQALQAHTVYAPEVRHPVEVSSANKTHLLKWLSKRLGNKVKAPLLTSTGFHLVGGRLLPGTKGIPAAQFMYEDQTGKRLTFYLSPASKKKDSSFHFYTAEKLSIYRWTDKPFQYAMVGNLTRKELKEICKVAYDSLES